MKKVVLCVLVSLITLATGYAVGGLGGLIVSNILNSDNETKTEETD